MDAIDEQILTRLSQSPLVSRSVLAKEVQLSRTACVSRIKRLEESGEIVGYHLVRKGDTGTPKRVMMLSVGTIKREARQQIEELIGNCKIVRKAYLITGEMSYLVEISQSESEDFRNLINELGDLDVDVQSRTFEVVETIK